METRLAEIAELLQKPQVYTDAGRCAELVREQRCLEKNLEKDVALWEEEHKKLQDLLREFSSTRR